MNLRPPGSTPLRAAVRKAAYLGSVMEYTVKTEIRPLFVIDGSVDRPVAISAEVAVAFAPRGVIAIPPTE